MTEFDNYCCRILKISQNPGGTAVFMFFIFYQICNIAGKYVCFGPKVLVRQK